MLNFRELVFDNTISGTGTNWYTSSTFDDQMGTADGLALHAVTTAVSGSSPTLTCQIQTSANGKDWYAAQGTAEINAASISNGTSREGELVPLMTVLQRFVRIRIALGGTNPKCRLKLHVTGKSWG